MESSALTALLLSLQLAGLSTLILLLIGLPFAWWLSQNHSKLKVVLEAFVALPLILPPTVLGFYLLILLGQNSLANAGWAFSFKGLVLGSVIYSFPFVVQPLQVAFESIGKQPLEIAHTLGYSSIRRFFKVVLPLSRRGLLSAITLGFTHTLGEFGVVLMIGGNIPGKTQVISIYIYDHVEQLQYHQANILSLGLLIFSFVVLLALYSLNHRYRRMGI